MIGAIAGDVVGSRFEWRNIKTKKFDLFSPECRFTDDTVLTVALADSLLTKVPYPVKLKEYYRLYPDAGYGGRFHLWANSESMEPYYSFGNGSAMRVSPVGWYFNDLDMVLREAAASAAVTHNHPEGIKGAQVAASAIFLARSGKDKEAIREFIIDRFAYDLDWRLEDIRPWYTFDVTCQGSVPQALQAFFEASDFEDAIRNAISIGGDSDTIACITGGIAEAFFGEVPKPIRSEVIGRLDERLSTMVRKFLQAVGRQAW